MMFLFPNILSNFCVPTLFKEYYEKHSGEAVGRGQTAPMRHPKVSSMLANIVTLSFKTTSIILVFSEKPLFLRTAMQEAPLPVFLFIVHKKIFL